MEQQGVKASVLTCHAFPTLSVHLLALRLAVLGLRTCCGSAVLAPITTRPSIDAISIFITTITTRPPPPRHRAALSHAIVTSTSTQSFPLQQCYRIFTQGYTHTPPPLRPHMEKKVARQATITVPQCKIAHPFSGLSSLDRNTSSRQMERARCGWCWVVCNSR